MASFVRQPCTIKMLTTCCEECGSGLEVPFVRQSVAKHIEDTPTYRQAENALAEWEREHQCENQPALVPA